MQPTQISSKLSIERKGFVLHAAVVSKDKFSALTKKQILLDHLYAATKTLEPLHGQKQAQICGLEESARSGMERSTFWQQLTIRSVYLYTKLYPQELNQELCGARSFLM